MKPLLSWLAQRYLVGIMCLFTSIQAFAWTAVTVEEDGVTYVAESSTRTTVVSISTEEAVVKQEITYEFNYKYYTTTVNNLRLNAPTLKKLTLPSSISFNSTSFTNTPLLETVISEDKEYTILTDEASGGKVLVNDGTLLAPINKLPDNFKIPDGITAIGSNAFYGCTNINELTIPSSVTSIGDFAFYGCTNLNSVTFEDSDTPLNIGSWIFEKSNIIKMYIGRNLIGGSFFDIHGNSKPTVKSVLYSNSVTSIGGLFWKCTSLAEVIISGNVTSINGSAFEGCTGIKKAACPNTITNPFTTGVIKIYSPDDAIVEDGMLYNKEKTALFYVSIMKEGDFTVSNGVKKINDYAFYLCSGLTEIKFPDALTSIGKSAFYLCSGLTEIKFPDALTSIGESAFSYCSGLTGMTFSDALTSIGERAFYECRGLTEVKFPDALTYIGEEAFYNCFGLTEVTFSDNLTEIGEYAFAWTNIKSVILPPSLTYLGRSAFYAPLVKAAYPSYMYNPFGDITTVCYPEKGSIIEDGWIYGPDKSAIYYAPYNLEGELTVPESVEAIGDNAFAHCNITEVNALPVVPPTMSKKAFDDSTYESALLTIPDESLGGYYSSVWQNFRNIRVEDATENVTEYNDEVFNYVYSPGSGEALLVAGDYGSLTNASVPNRIAIENGDDAVFYQVTAIGGNAFNGCTGMTSIKLPRNLKAIYDSAFKGCTGISEIELPDGVISIGQSAFENTRFTTISLPAGLQTIGASAFRGSQLASVTLPAGLQTIGASAFRGSQLASVTLPAGLQTIGASAFQESKITDVVLPAALESIGNSAFMNCKALTNVNCSKSSAIIGAKAFMNNSALTKVDFTESAVSIGSYAFSGCSSLKSVELSDLIAVVDTAAFYSCGSLEKVIIGSNIDAIARYAFRECGRLADVAVGKNVNTIGYGAFYGCKALKNIVLPSSLNTIDGFAFSESGLESIEIPQEVTVIGNAAFQRCSSLELAEIGNGVVELSDYAFSSCSNLSVVELGDSIERIGKYAFAGCSRLGSINIPASVDSIDSYAFQNCESLSSFILADGTKPIELGESIVSYAPIVSAHIGRDFNSDVFRNNGMKKLTIGNSVTAVCDNAFQGCDKLSSLTLGASLQSIGASAFQGCPLTDVVIPPTVETIGASAFESSAIKSLAIGYGIKSIGENAFSDNNAIENIYITAVNPPSASNTTFSYYEAPLWLVNQEAFDNYIDYPRCWYRFEDNMQPLKQINEISTDKLTVSGMPGEVIKLDVTIVPADATLPNIFWKSTRPDLVSVDSEGNVTILAEPEDDTVARSSEECKIIAMTMYEDVPLLEVGVNVQSSGIDDIITDTDMRCDIDYTAPCEVYNLNGIRMGAGIDGLAAGIYIVRQGTITKKIAVK